MADSSISRDAIKSTINDIIAKQIVIDANKITDTSTLKDLGADSLDTVEVIMNVEDKYNITIPDESAQEFKNVGDIITYIFNNYKPQ